ncbi:DENN domain-containing protein 1A-like isoform X2 [Dendronephthya gigantea]|uniref:DENN domain-containing protein 1A-like isoform X2 n=1 Tax=Dendronephthya gigantea TaxID=151771 RepID=UPI00106A2B66|nr:DENN domain-containing protein 1A-like isoform X2 [Dendronephthya gigantea]
MGSRLRPVPEKIFECLVEVTAPHSEKEGAELKSFFPDNYEDVDMLKDVVTKFCFPFAHDAEMVDAVQHFAFVLTDIDGFFRFGFCRYPPKAKTCLCILSDLPAFEMFYGILNTLAELENTAKDQPLTSKQFLDLVLDSQVPEPGTKFTVSDPVIDWTRQYNYPDPGKLPTIPENRNLTDYFSAVNPSNMIALFASMMFERRIIVTSKRLSLLTACTYSASLLLYPMHWQHVFIPVMPPSLLDYCSAPMPFLVGVHSSLMEKVRDMPLDDVVILDIDKEEIELSGDCFHDVDDLPSEAVSKLNSALKKNTIAIGEYVARAFLGAVVILIGGYRDALKLSGDTIIFREDMFLTSRPHMKSFLENLLKLQLFERFIHHRLDQLNLGEAIDDVFEEQIGLQTESDSKWVTQYKHWMKNRKRHGTQLLNSLSGKTEQATYRAKKFIHAGVKHGKNGFKEAVKGMKEKKKKEKDGYDNSLSSAVRRTHSLPMSHANAVSRDQNFDARNSVGSALQNRVNLTPSPTRSQRPERPPPRVPDEVSPKIPPRQPPPRPPPMRRPSPPPPYQSREVSNDPEVKSRPSMVRNPGDPGVKDLINFYDSQQSSTDLR